METKVVLPFTKEAFTTKRTAAKWGRTRCIAIHKRSFYNSLWHRWCRLRVRCIAIHKRSFYNLTVKNYEDNRLRVVLPFTKEAFTTSFLLALVLSITSCIAIHKRSFYNDKASYTGEVEYVVLPFTKEAFTTGNCFMVGAKGGVVLPFTKEAFTTIFIFKIINNYGLYCHSQKKLLQQSFDVHYLIKTFFVVLPFTKEAFTTIKKMAKISVKSVLYCHSQKKLLQHFVFKPLKINAIIRLNFNRFYINIIG